MLVKPTVNYTKDKYGTKSKSPRSVSVTTFLANINSMPRPVCTRINPLNSSAYLIFTPDCDAVSVFYVDTIGVRGKKAN
eukprot:gnl/Chilomastix_caulleri/5889.p1 GENE.gnl/Chilomastix_caulleri/5889~~gnl/Chilomastix_caulleri/5889.p1  ORF type:complete len:79 (+),score=17.64 gnl/Chilomastix_caulleri/5889:2-238(+)